jgi:hypothetical protein
VVPPAPINIPAPPVNTPGAGFISPLPTFGADIPTEQTLAFQGALINIVQRGSLTDMMDTIIADYGTTKDHRAWRSKAKYLMDFSREGDPKVAHVKAGVLLLATRINFISADLKYLTNAYISEMFMAIARKGPSSTWSMTTVAETGRHGQGEICYLSSQGRGAGLQGACQAHVRPIPEQVSMGYGREARYCQDNLMVVARC